jgi:hypothetical protein
VTKADLKKPPSGVRQVLASRKGQRDAQTTLYPRYEASRDFYQVTARGTHCLITWQVIQDVCGSGKIDY